MTSATEVSAVFTPDDFSPHRKRLSRIMNWIAFALLLACLGLLVYFWVWASTPVTVMDLYHTPLRVQNVNREIDQGQPLTYAIEYCKYVDATPTMSRELVAVDGRDLKIMLPLVSGSLETGCHQTTLVEAVPGWVPSGKYILRITRVYGTRTFVDHPSVFETEPFAVR